ncbi:MAG TPA: NUDIX domain-containing protein [Stellaceae bacterium]|nr:NUDIX domain-containing protein [Stellaceae bacterium]
MSDAAIEILDRETAYQGFFRIDRYRLRHRLYSGGWSGELAREVFERGNAAGVLLYDPARDALVLIEQFRLAAHLAGFAAWQLEIVAGIIDRPGESALDVVRREAQEEAGLTIDGEVLPIHRYLTSPGGSTETVALYCGRVDSSDAGGIHGLADEHEDIKVVVKSYDDAMALLRDGKIDNGFTIVALYWLAANRERLRRSWA